MAYIGVPPFGNTVRTVTNITATSGQTTFNIVGGYVQGYVDVHLNGVLLIPGTDFTATDGLTVVLTVGATAGDEFQAFSYQTLSLTDAYRQSEVDTLLAAKADTADIPTAVSELTNDSGYLTSSTGVTTVNGSSGAVTVQPTLVSGTNIKTINSTSLLGSGDIAITSSPAGSNTYVQYNNGGSFGGSANFVFDGTNVGIGTSSPTSKLHVYGGAGTNIGIQASTGRHWRLGDGVGSTNGNFVIYDYTGGAKKLELDTSGNLLFNSGYGSVAPAYGCRAWVNFNGTGTVSINASGNVSSITDNGTGDYTVNFTNAMPDINYSVGGSGAGTLNSDSCGPAGLAGSTNYKSTTSLRFGYWYFTGNSLTDRDYINLQIFR